MVSPPASPPKRQLRERKIDASEIPPAKEFQNREKMLIIILSKYQNTKDHKDTKKSQKYQKCPKIPKKQKLAKNIKK